jgi:putative transposase
VREFILSMLAVFRVFCQSRSDTALEVLALRQQVAVLKRKRPRPVLNSLDRLFWTTLRHLWSRWSDVLVIVKPETVIRWRRAGSDCTGVGDPAGAAADRRSPMRSGG